MQTSYVGSLIGAEGPEECCKFSRPDDIFQVIELCDARGYYHRVMAFLLFGDLHGNE